MALLEARAARAAELDRAYHALGDARSRLDTPPR